MLPLPSKKRPTMESPTSKSLEIYDTTLRDGSQQEGISLTVGDKLQIAMLLDELGVDYIEGGWPGALPKDDEFFARARKEIDFRSAALVSFGSTRPPAVVPRPIRSWKPSWRRKPRPSASLASHGTTTCWRRFGRPRRRGPHGGRVDRVSPPHDRRVFFDAEHFFDGYRNHPDYALRVIRAAHEAGAERSSCATPNGGNLPRQIVDVIGQVGAAIAGAEIGVHFHNDAGCAVASSLAAVEAGVRQIQGCVNGYGERTGNADLSSILPDLVLKMGRPVLSGDQLGQLAPISHHIAEIVNITLDPHRPYVGDSAFTHKAGLHTSAIARRPDAYEHVPPGSIGNRTRMVVSEQAGRASVLSKSSEFGLELTDAQARQVLERVKELEHVGFSSKRPTVLSSCSQKGAGVGPPFFAVESSALRRAAARSVGGCRSPVNVIVE